MRMVTTGIQGLDAHFSGGVPSGSTILCLSEPSNAPYLFCEQFAAGGLGAMETVYYYNLERPKVEVVERVRNLLAKQEVLKNLQYFDCYSVKLRDLSAPMLKRMGIENHAVKVNEDVVARLPHHPKDAPFRVIIESVTEAIEAYGLEPTLTMLNMLSGMVKMMNGVALVMLVRGLHDPHVEMRLRHLVDGVIEFGVERQGFGLYSYLSVTKMRGVQDANRLLLYKETEKGLWLESTRRVF
jgi:KaiC/GvpD/RAD55 family RecA-like ATPase